jgi:hypothetical protein
MLAARTSAGPLTLLQWILLCHIARDGRQLAAAPRGAWQGALRTPTGTAADHAACHVLQLLQVLLVLLVLLLLLLFVLHIVLICTWHTLAGRPGMKGMVSWGQGGAQAAASSSNTRSTTVQ